MKIPPCHVEAEEEVLGALLLEPDGSVFRDVSEHLSVEDFYIEGNGIIFDAIATLVRNNKPSDGLHVESILQASGKLSSVGGRSRIAQLLDRCVHTGAAAHHAALVKEKSVLRKLIKIANSVTEKCYRADVEQNSKNLIADVQGQLLELSSFDEISRVKSFASLMPMVFEEISASNAGDSSVDVCVPTGYYDIDDTTGGLPLGALSVIGGRGGIGKSTMALDIAIFNAKRGANVVYFALEMSASQMCKKAIARLVAPEVPATLLFKRNGLEGVHWDSVAQGISQAQELSIWVQDASIRKPSQIRSDMQEVVVKSGRPIDLCIIDYAQLVEPERHQSNRVIEVDSILKQLRSIAKDFGCAVLALSQLSRGLEARSDKRPTKADFRESGGFEQEAALMLGIYRDDYYNPNTEEKNIVELSILKSRFSGDGIVKLLFDRDYGVFKNLKY